MAQQDFEPYMLDPESESELEVEQQERRHKFYQSVTARDSSTWDQNGSKIIPQHRNKSNCSLQMESIEVTVELEPQEDHLSESEAPARCDDGDVSEEEQGPVKVDASSDEDWAPQTLTEEGDDNVEKTSSEEESDDEDEDFSEKPSRGRKVKQLCTDCGSFHSSKPHVCEHKTKPFVCNVCGKRCVTEHTLKAHSKIHSDSYEHYCKYCYDTFKTKNFKLNHELTHQNESKPYKCPDCGETFASLMERRKHMKSHRGPNEFKCDICGMAIGKKHKLRHMLVHTGAKPYRCSICERTFNQAGNLKSHMRLHTGERPYKCQHCDKAFNHNVSLKSHMQRYHSPESEFLLDKNYEDSTDVHDGTVGDSADLVPEQDTEQTEKPEGAKCRTGRPRGRPKGSTPGKSSKSPEEHLMNSYVSHDGSEGFTDYLNVLIDYHQEKIVKAERNIKRKQKRRGSSDSDYDPNEETFRPGKRGRPRKV